MPDQKAREEILTVHGRNKPLASDVDLIKIAQMCIGFSGADLENLMNEAAILAAKSGKKKITHKMIDGSIEKVLMGPEKKSRKMSKKELEVTAYHEVGHAFVASSLEHCDPVQKVSIIARGQALGVTWFMPKEDARLKVRQKFIDEMAAMFGGYAAEQVFFGDVSTGPSNDLEKATALAKAMVLKYGMGEKLGPVSYGDSGGSVFLGKELTASKHYSEDTARAIDKEIETFVKDAHKTAVELMKNNKAKVKKISEKLLKDEVLTGDEFRKLM
jgi:cell division protease FtsH